MMTAHNHYVSSWIILVVEIYYKKSKSLKKGIINFQNKLLGNI